jgi:hypothetical protein
MSEQLSSDPSDTPKTDAAEVIIITEHGGRFECVPASFAREQERRITELEQAMTKVRESLRCTKTAPHAYDADHHCDTCGSSSAYAKDLIDEVIRP